MPVPPLNFDQTMKMMISILKPGRNIASGTILMVKNGAEATK